MIFDKRRFQNEIKMRSYGAYFLEKMQKRKSVFRLHRRVRIACEPIPWSAQGDPKIKEKTWHISEPTFLIKRCKNMRKRGPKRCPKGWGDFRGGGLGGALDGLWRPNLFLNTNNMPKVLQKWLQGCRNYTKRPGGLRAAIKWSNLLPVHLGIHATATYRRRTGTIFVCRCPTTTTGSNLEASHSGRPACWLLSVGSLSKSPWTHRSRRQNLKSVLPRLWCCKQYYT